MSNNEVILILPYGMLNSNFHFHSTQNLFNVTLARMMWVENEMKVPSGVEFLEFLGERKNSKMHESRDIETKQARNITR
jgi:hypothetical protein